MQHQHQQPTATNTTSTRLAEIPSPRPLDGIRGIVDLLLFTPLAARGLLLDTGGGRFLHNNRAEPTLDFDPVIDIFHDCGENAVVLPAAARTDNGLELYALPMCRTSHPSPVGKALQRLDELLPGPDNLSFTGELAEGWDETCPLWADPASIELFAQVRLNPRIPRAPLTPRAVRLRWVDRGPLSGEGIGEPEVVGLSRREFGYLRRVHREHAGSRLWAFGGFPAATDAEVHDGRGKWWDFDGWSGRLVLLRRTQGS